MLPTFKSRSVREIKVIFKYSFKAVVGLEYIQRLMTEYRVKALGVPCGLCNVAALALSRAWKLSLVAGNPITRFYVREMRPEDLRSIKYQGIAATASICSISRQLILTFSPVTNRSQSIDH